MQEYIEQCKYNVELLEALEEKFPENYFDWKITIAFYVTIHCIKAILRKKLSRNVSSHEEIINIISHKKAGNSSPVSKSCWNMYYALYSASRDVRYNGFTDFKSFNEHNESEFRICKAQMENIMKYAHQKQQVPVLD
ncbi:hypothetical protein MATR_09860 [Marivirga tractuosa]|uniref:HEPN domain-containing protein n=1 Tax=Marivirga tractuosa (strain ATCC 23168 / DSM 4126 / NBRC 15989 / NCIMB 1408 / VKM B-1430 / H-43) TaxID=643867 RepID=E4TMV4_MARTH|nr:hypothetical protein [Marivirga tractuosa]ADR21385.1 hypothetical protein Ftrac_1395 [Marivirga tractuosa DSM 4126]BDD14161.1 hypothetical protein MATR_09860 [Marivirga tractuosa]